MFLIVYPSDFSFPEITFSTTIEGILFVVVRINFLALIPKVLLLLKEE